MIKRAYFNVFKKGIETLRRKGKDELTFEYFKKKYLLNLRKEKFDPNNLSDKEKIFILHYLNSPFVKKNENLITFKELPTCNIYFPSIHARVYQPIIEKYGKNPEDFVRKGMEIGGVKIKNTSIKFDVFPEVFYIFELVPEDEEFSAEVKVLFNKTTVNIFPVEDIVVISEEITSKLTGE